jgi:hypothetical protein
VDSLAVGYLTAGCSPLQQHSRTQKMLHGQKETRAVQVWWQHISHCRWFSTEQPAMQIQIFYLCGFFFLPIDSISQKAVIVLGQRGLFLPCLQKRIYLDQYRMLLGPKLLSLEQSENDVF